MYYNNNNNRECACHANSNKFQDRQSTTKKAERLPHSQWPTILIIPLNVIFSSNLCSSSNSKPTHHLTLAASKTRGGPSAPTCTSPKVSVPPLGNACFVPRGHSGSFLLMRVAAHSHSCTILLEE